MKLMTIVRFAGVTAVFFGAIAAYGAYRYVQVEPLRVTPGVSCFTGQFPALTPVPCSRAVPVP